MRPEGAGFIVRTVAEGRQREGAAARTWSSSSSCGTRSSPSRSRSRRRRLLYNDLDLLLRTVRDLFTPHVDKLIVDNKSGVRAAARSSSARSCRDFGGKIELYDGREPIFDGYGIESEIDRALERKVSLQVGRLAHHRPGRGAHRHRRQHRQVRRQEVASRRRSPRPTSRRARRSPISCACATSAASSSSTSSTWTASRTARR